MAGNRKIIPRVSIGLPVLNGENFIAEAIDSILAQTYENFELIIVDAASIDKTEEICRNYAQKDSRIKYFRQNETRGVYVNYNRLFDLSKGEYFRWHAHDDTIAPNYLENCVTILDTDPEVILVFTRTNHIDENGDLLKKLSHGNKFNVNEPEKRFARLVHWGSCNVSFGLIRVEMLPEKTSPMMPMHPYAEGVFLLELSLRGRIYEIPEYLWSFRIHDKQYSNTHRSYLFGREFFDFAKMYFWFEEQDRRFKWPHFRIAKAYIDVANSAPNLTFIQTFICYLSVLKWAFMLPNIRRLSIDIARFLKIPGFSQNQKMVNPPLASADFSEPESGDD